MKVIDQTKIYEEYKGKWVILDTQGTKVLASDKKLAKAILKFRQKFGPKAIPFAFKVPTELLPYVGC